MFFSHSFFLFFRVSSKALLPIRPLMIEAAWSLGAAIGSNKGKGKLPKPTPIKPLALTPAALFLYQQALNWRYYTLLSVTSNIFFWSVSFLHTYFLYAE